MIKSQKENLRILVFAPHPDDEIIGCGGSIAKHLDSGNEVFVIFTTNGTAECQEFSPDEFVKIRRAETLKAAQFLGLKEKNLFFLNKQPWELNEKEIRFAFLRLVRQIKPDVCYVPHIYESHIDHQIVNKTAIDAINMGPGKWFKPYGSNEESSHSATILAYEVGTPLISPNYFEDITLFIEVKMNALKKHKSQNGKKYEQAHRGLNSFRGAIYGGSSHAEAFQILKILKIF